jgi:type II secretory pathway pseudopilin PulG
MRNNKTRIRSSSGFLLFELMVSLTIVAIAIMGVLFCFNQSVKSFSLANDYERARIIVQNQLDALRLEDRLVPGETLISLEGDDAKYLLKQTIKPTSQELLYQVSLLITWRKGSGEEAWEIETLFPSSNPFGSARKTL